MVLRRRKFVISGPTTLNLNEMQDNQDSDKPKTRFQYVKDNLVEFCSESSIHGVKYFVGSNRHWFEKTWWVIAFLLSFVWCCISIGSIWVYWQSHPVAIELHNQFQPINKIPFPAVTICSTEKFDRNKINIDHYIELSHAIAANESIIKSLSPDTINNLDYLSIAYPNLMSWPKTAKVSRTKSIYNTMRRMRPSMNSIILKTKFKGKGVHLKPIFIGSNLCYTFNSLNSKDLFTDEITSELLTVKGNPEATWQIENGYTSDLMDAVEYPHRVFGTSHFGDDFIAELLIRVVDSKRAKSGIADGFQLLLHSPDQFPRKSHNAINIPAYEETFIAVKPKLISTDRGLRYFSPEVRGCLLQSERKLQFFKTYNQLNCELECMSNATLTNCGCVKLSSPRNNQTKVCTAQEKECFNMAMSTVAVTPFSGNCSCLPACHTISYQTEISRSPKLTKANYTNIFFLSFKSHQYTALIRKETQSTTGFISSCGGILSLFMGISALSIIELIYYFTLRLGCKIWQSRSTAVAPAAMHNEIIIVHE